jgi:hypothetical protein
MEAEARPLFKKVARKALHLREFGLSYCTVTRRLETDDKAVAKAVRWLERLQL